MKLTTLTIVLITAVACFGIGVTAGIVVSRDNTPKCNAVSLQSLQSAIDSGALELNSGSLR